MEPFDGGITDVPGFSVAGLKAGIKDDTYDMAVVYADRPAAAAAVFTRNKIQGAPIHLARRHLKDGTAQAIVANSGIANVATGEAGIEDCKVLVTTAGEELGVPAKSVLVSSTGLIGRRLPIERMRQALFGVKDALGTSVEHRDQAAAAIMTTDTRPKRVAVRVGDIVIGGMAKGAGMIHPNMGTMLVFLCTNADIRSEELQRVLSACVDRSFNLISIDGDTSTSDSVFLLAGGSGGPVNPKEFETALLWAMRDLAQQIVADGEGATKVLRVDVIGARNRGDASKAARAVIVSPLVKAGFPTMHIPGRILCAVGNSGAEFNPFSIDLYYGDECVVRNGAVIDYDKAAVDAVVAEKTVRVTVNLQEGGSHATAWGCDLTAEYVRINAELYT